MSTVLLGILLDDQLVYIDKRESPGPIRIASDVGWRHSPHFGMLGVTLMANLDDREVSRLLEESPLTAHTPRSITDEAAFRRRLEEVWQIGVTVEVDEAHLGIWGVAAPIYDARGQVIAALGSALPVSEHSEDREREVVARGREVQLPVPVEGSQGTREVIFRASGVRAVIRSWPFLGSVVVPW